MLCVEFGWNWAIEKNGEEDEIVKSLQTDEQTDDGQQAIRILNLDLKSLNLTENSVNL